MNDVEEHAAVVQIVEKMTNAEKVVLAEWLENLLRIRELNIPKHSKILAIAKASSKSRILIPLAKQVFRQLQQMLWTKRSGNAKAFIAGAGISLAMFGSSAAGLAAFGTAIGLPLWIVFGAGASLANMLYSEIVTSLRKP